MGVKAGYTLDRDKRGLTEREREVLADLVLGRTPRQTAEVHGLSKQRVWSILNALKKKNVLAMYPNGDVRIVLQEER